MKNNKNEKNNQSDMQLPKPPVSIEQLKTWFEHMSKQPKDPNLKLTCLCGKCDLEVNLTDEHYKLMADIINSAETPMT